MLKGESNTLAARNNYQRAANLRQNLLSTSRAVNTAIIKGLHEKGFSKLRSTHTALLSNLDMRGENLTVVASRAGITKQAMGRLVDELVQLKYIKRNQDKIDRRAIKLQFTPKGINLMQQSFAVMADIEKRCAKSVGKDNYKQLLGSLALIAKELEYLNM